jgi:hypothetical protein
MIFPLRKKLHNIRYCKAFAYAAGHVRSVLSQEDVWNVGEIAADSLWQEF